MNPPAPKILLIGWDAADWQIIKPLLDSGRMPNLEKMIEQGVMGNLSTLRPILSPMLWNSIATGVRPEKHGILGFTHVDPTTKKVRPYHSNSRKVKALWNILSQEGRRCHVVNWLASHPAEKVNGVTVSESFIRHLHASPANAPLPAGGVNPDHLAASLAGFRVRPEDIDSTTMRLFVPRLAEIDQAKDHNLEVLAKQLADCFTTHAVITHLLETEPWDFAAVYFTAIDHICHAFMKYRAPRLPAISEREFEFYKDVVDHTYQLHDLLLGRQLELAGEDCTVIICSDHGYQTDSPHRGSSINTPLGPTHDHRPTGIFVMRGPNVRKDELIHGAGLLDIAPTILTVAGLPISDDMGGRPLLEAFTTIPPVKKIPSWESVPGPEWRVPDVADSSDSKLIEQFVALGYVQPQAGSQEFYARTVQAETDWTLAGSLIYSGQFSVALPILEKIYDEFPLRFDFGCMLGECYLRLRLFDEARQIIVPLAESFPGRPMARILLGALESESGNVKAGLDHFLQAEKLGGASPDLFVRLGRLYFRLGQVEAGLAVFEKSLALDPDNALGHAGRARCLLRLKRFEDAAEAALDAVGLEFSLAEAHLTLGLALVRLGQFEKAIGALETCVRFNPLRLAAHRFLISLYEKIGGHDDHIRAHQKQIRLCMETVSRRRLQVDQLREETRSRAQQRDEARPTTIVTPKPRVSRPAAKKSAGQEYLIVSGLPRSGTSLMMQMLHRGGFPVMRDDQRTPDIDNPEGYFEWEEIKQLPANHAIIEKCEGRAVKIVSPLLIHLPRNARYKVIFMDRPVEEVAISQGKMRNRLSGKALTVIETAEMERLLREHRAQVLAGLRAATQVSLLTLDYRELVSAPERAAERVADFVGRERLPHWQSMAAVVKPELYRNRSTPEKPSA